MQKFIVDKNIKQIKYKQEVCYLGYRIQAPTLISSQSASIKKAVLWNYVAAKVHEL